jgi:hypothetical protein
MKTSELQDARTSVHELASQLFESGEMVRADNFVRFSSIYSAVHRHLTGTDPFNIRIRRAFNRHNKIATADDNPTWMASTIALIAADELDPSYTWLEMNP